MHRFFVLIASALFLAGTVSASPWAAGFEQRGAPRISFDELQEILLSLECSESQTEVATEQWRAHQAEAKEQNAEAKRIERAIKGEDNTGEIDFRWKEKTRIEEALAKFADAQAARDREFIEMLRSILSPEQASQLDASVTVHVLVSEFNRQPIAAADTVRIFRHLRSASDALKTTGLSEETLQAVAELESTWIARLEQSIGSLRARTVKNARTRNRADDKFIAFNDDGSYSRVSRETPSARAGIARTEQHVAVSRQFAQAQLEFSTMLRSLDESTHAVFEISCHVDATRSFARSIKDRAGISALWASIQSDESNAEAITPEVVGKLVVLRAKLTSLQRSDLRCAQLRAKVVGGEADVADLRDRERERNELRQEFASELRSMLESVAARSEN